MLKEQHGFKTVVMIGDGATDLEASPPAVSAHSACVHTFVFDGWVIHILKLLDE